MHIIVVAVGGGVLVVVVVVESAFRVILTREKVVIHFRAVVNRDIPYCMYV